MDEPEIRRTFEQTVAVRALGSQAKQLVALLTGARQAHVREQFKEAICGSVQAWRWEL